MIARLAAHVEVAALLRRVAAAGGAGAVLARGDREAGAILIVLADRGRTTALLERRLTPAGYRWRPAGPEDVTEPQRLDAYVEKRRRSDPDLWAIELDVAGSPRLAEELAAEG